MRGPRRFGCATLLAVLGLSGCASGDPRSDGPFGTLHGLISGSYAQRQREQQSVVADSNRRLGVAQGESRRLQENEAQEVQKVATLRVGVQRMQAETSELRARIAGLEAERGTTDARNAALSAELRDVETKLAELSHSTDHGEEIAGLERRQADLQREVARLRAAVSAIGPR